MIKCPHCGAEFARGIPFCPICGATLGFSFRPVIAALIHSAIGGLALHFIPPPYCYAVALPFAVLALISLGAAGFGLFRSIFG